MADLKGNLASGDYSGVFFVAHGCYSNGFSSLSSPQPHGKASANKGSGKACSPDPIPTITTPPTLARDLGNAEPQDEEGNEHHSTEHEEHDETTVAHRLPKEGFRRVPIDDDFLHGIISLWDLFYGCFGLVKPS
jgi:hypothetical protein